MDSIMTNLAVGAGIGFAIPLIAAAALVFYFVALPRLFPAVAAKRKLKKDEASQRRYAKFQQKQELDDQRIRQWAESHPDDPVARRAMESLAPSPPPFKLGSEPQPEPTEANDEFDPADELRQRFEAEQRYKDMRTQEDRTVQQLLDWSLENPDCREARWFLEKQLDQLLNSVKSASTRVQLYESRLGWIDKGSLEAQLCRSDLDDAKRELESEQALTRRIQVALGEAVPDNISS